MEIYFEVLKKSSLFQGIVEKDLSELITCLGGRVKKYAKEEIVMRIGERTTHFGILLSGKIRIVRDSFSGEREIVGEILPGQLFAESYAFASSRIMPVSVICTSLSSVLLLEGERISQPCSTACSFHRTLISNLINILAEKNVLLNRKLGHMSKRTTKEKLLSYLSEQAAIHGEREFMIPFNRQELADYLGVERSAMSSALCRLRDDGALTFHKNSFCLIKQPESYA